MIYEEVSQQEKSESSLSIRNLMVSGALFKYFKSLKNKGVKFKDHPIIGNMISQHHMGGNVPKPQNGTFTNPSEVATLKLDQVKNAQGPRHASQSNLLQTLLSLAHRSNSKHIAALIGLRDASARVVEAAQLQT